MENHDRSNKEVANVDQLNLEPTVLGSASELTEEGGSVAPDREVIIYGDV